MVEKRLLNQIEKDFLIVVENKDILGILLYGSHAQGESTNRSDVDICIVAPKENDFELLSFILGNVNVVLKKYDIRIFSELPLYIKIQVIENGILIYSLNNLDLYEYFYFYRKIWADQKHRQEISREELLSLL